MKQAILIFIAFIAAVSCNNGSTSGNSTVDSAAVPGKKPAKEIIRMDTIKVNKLASNFYAICANEHFGWCSPLYPSYDEANKALQKHRDSTGHTDNTVSNDCPF